MMQFKAYNLPFKICNKLVEFKRKLTSASAKKPRYELTTPDLAHALELRFDSSDRQVYRQIFDHGEYAPLCDLSDVKVIVDCGAYAGISGRYFLKHFPEAHLICLEPSQSNFDLLQRNLRFYESQVTLINKGVWSKSTGLNIVKEQYRDGKEWTFQLQECAETDTADVEAIGIMDVLALRPNQNIDILKMDVERAERFIFAEDTFSWLSRVRNIAIELHDEECERVFFEAMKPFEYTLSHSGDLTICKHISVKESHE